ncbi:MAG: TolC family outer membrane protein [Gammaproteobacteria bacterium]|nr:TolC family outer membrane protein [Gammaproteobacteria bacterium]
MKAAPTLSGVLLAGWLVGSLTGAPGVLAAQEGDGEFADTTLAGVYELAVDNDLTIAQARAELRAGKEERKLALSGLLPQVQGTFDYSDSDTESRGSFPAGNQLFPNASNTEAETDTWAASLRQPLFDLPAWFRFKQGVELSNQAQATFTVAQQELIVRAVAAYFEVLRASTNLKASRAQESALQGQLEQVKQRFEVGMVAITDVHEAQAGYDLAVAQRIADEGQVGIARELLTVVTGRSHGDLWVLDDEFPVVDPEPASSADWVRFARENNFDIKVAQYARDAAQRGARAAASEHLPTVDLSLSYSDASTDVVREDLVGGTTSRFPNEEERGVVALNLTVPIFTGGFTSASRRQAGARYDSRIASYQGTLRTVTQETRASHIKVLSDVARTRARAQAVTSTRSALEAAEVGYEVGTRNVVDVLRAQQEFFSAVRDYENSIIDYVVDLVRLKRLAGTLTPEDVYELNQWLEQPADPTLSGEDGNPSS